MAKILLVEDNEMNRDMLSRRLERKGYEVILAIDGEEAVVRAEADGPDLVLMDIGLPGIDGCEATRRIRTGPAGTSLPIIALTAHAMGVDEARAREAGCDDFDTKPIDLPRLLGKMEKLLSGAR
ncbi:response regulator [Shinella sp.]|uniref:response regulator n=1 Tax=Shinella sp. TaxID=1870904 RepID=UPI0040354D68